ncbi:hypothetical protein LG329_04675 [Virgibacillus necropolis]|uniref:pLS20_p028 family conjugation system transmembrane protein n=1 Tax=Virgibacillus necropolis TaxID=163877 RepID=UPI00384BA0BC
MNTVEILEKFAGHLDITNPIMFLLREIGWIFIKGMAWLVNSLENVINSVLGLKGFYSSTKITEFVDTIQPILITLFAFNILYIGFLVLFQKKFNREGIVINVFMALAILVILGTGLDKVNKFTDDAINVINMNGTESIATSVIKENITDVALLDKSGWKKANLDVSNNISQEHVRDINITATIDDDFEFANGDSLSNVGQDVLSNKIMYTGKPTLKELDGGWFSFDEYYYRWSWNFWNMALTLGIMAFVLITTSVKLTKLFFELTFNYLIAGIIAPLDMHSGQKMKQVIQNIVNIFVTTIMIFLSMKVYLIGTDWLEEETGGLVYIIAMLGFAMAVIDGPNIVERLFGIDAGMSGGMKSIAGAYAGVKGLGKGARVGGNHLISAGGKTASAGGFVAGLASGGKGSSGSSQSNEGKDKEGKGENGEGQKNQSREGGDSSSQAQEETASSLENDMDQESNQGESNFEISGLHDEMEQQGYERGEESSNQGSSSKENTPSFENEIQEKNNQAAPNGSSESISGLHDEMEQSTGGNLTSSGGSQQASVGSIPTGGGSAPSEPSQPSTGSVSTGGGAVPSESTPQSKQETNQTQTENRHVGQVVSDRFNQNKTVKQSRNSYQIGKNTAESIKKQSEKSLEVDKK